MPGPGKYDIIESNNWNSWIQSALKYTIGKERRLNKTESDVPGPGNYEIKENLGKNGVMIGKEKRIFIDKKNKFSGPCPGSYNFKSSFPDVPNYAF